MATKSKPAPFKHTSREMAVLTGAHNDMMARVNAGQRYDVRLLAWVDADGNVVRDDRQWLAARKQARG